jgi:hypothetical protein
MNGTAANYLAGNTLIGTSTDAGFRLDVNGTARVQSTLISGGGTPLVLTGESFALQAISAGLPSGAVFGTNVANNPSFINILSGNNFWHISNRSSTNANRLGIFNASFTGTTATYTSELLTISTTGSVGIGSTSLTGYNLRVSKNITGATTAYGIAVDGAIQSDVTSSARLFWTLPSIAAGSAVTDVYHYITGQGLYTGTVTNQYGFVASSSLTGGTNNYGFWGNVPSGTNRWNLYMAGTAANYMAGRLGIGITNAAYDLDVFSGTANVSIVSNTNNNGFSGIVSTFNSAYGNFIHMRSYGNTTASTIFGISTNGMNALWSNNDTIYAIGTIGATAMVFGTNNTERVRVKSTGQMRFVPLASDPSGAQAGDVYYNSTTNALKLYDGTVWRTITVV